MQVGKVVTGETKPGVKQTTDNPAIGQEGREVQPENKQQEKKDTLEISREARDRLLEMYQEQAENAKKQGKATDDMAKLMEVARRIANGDKVPAKDEQKLMEFSMEMYQMAKQAAMVNDQKKHKKWESMFDEEGEDHRDMLRKLEQTEDMELEVTQTAPDVEIT